MTSRIKTVIGADLFAKDPHGKLKSRIATIFPATGTLVTLPTIHVFQRNAYLERLRAERVQRFSEPMTAEEESLAFWGAVDLIVEGDTVCIRPDPENMRLAYEADELLQEIVPKNRIKYLEVFQPKVREAIKRRGDCWRISPLPTSRSEMVKMLSTARIGLGGKRETYYYNPASGSRWLTYQEFAALATLDDAALRDYLNEIRELSARVNSQGNPEIRFFMANKFGKADFVPHEFAQMSDAALRLVHEHLRDKFFTAVPADFRRDDPEHDAWRSRMYGALIGQTNEAVAEEELIGLGLEFFRAVRWLPGARIENGRVFFDSIFNVADGELKDLCDPAVRQLISNLVLEFGDLEYVNVATVIEPLSKDRELYGRRAVYLVELKRRSLTQETVSHIRFQKLGTREHLAEGKPLDGAMLEDAEYTESILDRWFACRQLGMNLPQCLVVRHVTESHGGGMKLRCAYYQRDYVRGTATDKLATSRFEDEEFALRFARLLGRAAAVNIIVGRCDQRHHVLFDDGDEILIEDERGQPMEIITAEDTGSFRDCEGDLDRCASAYASKVAKRLAYVPRPEEFTGVFLQSFAQRLAEIQDLYRSHRADFDTLFSHRPQGSKGSVASRWTQILARLDRTDPEELAGRIGCYLPAPVA